MIKITCDFETRSRLPIKVGAWKYSKHQSTEVLCFSWEVDDEYHLWHPAYPHLDIEEEGREALDELFFLLATHDETELVLEAHNAFFEQCIWMNVCVPKLGWPETIVQRWRCSAAKASMHALPRALEAACEALGTIEKKDMLGSKVMKKLARPKKDGSWHESVDDFEVLWAYNLQDVRAEKAFSDELYDLTPLEQRMWFMDQEINFRGVLADRALAVHSLEVVAELKRRNNVRFKELTGIASASQRKVFKDFCEVFGLDLPDTKGETVRRLLEGGTIEDPELVEALRIVYENNRTSTAKYSTALKVMDDDDDRIRGSLMYWGAERTARWAGRLIQPHNFPRGHINDMDAACEFIVESELDDILRHMNLYSKKDSSGNIMGFKDVMEFLSHALRGLIKATDGNVLAVSDFSAIEARVLFYLAGETEALQLLERGDCIYCDMATSIYGYACNKKEHPDERQLGKQAILGLGFSMGGAKFVETCVKYDIPITDKLAEHVVKAYRKKYPKVGQFWTDQEDAAILAMLLHGRSNTPLPGNYEPNENLEIQDDGWVKAGKISWRREGKFLFCRLPSGRCNAYPFPQLVEGEVFYFQGETMQANKELRVTRWITVTNLSGVKWTEGQVRKNVANKAKKMGLWLFPNQEIKERKKYTLKYKGITPERKWDWIHTYSGKITENIVQGTARDLMAEAMLRAHEQGTYEVALSVHDELVTEVEEWLGDLEEFNALMAEVPEWAEGCPINAEGWRGLRYRK